MEAWGAIPMPRSVSQAFVSSVLFGVNKAFSRIMTESGGRAISKCIAEGMFEFLEDAGLARRDMSNEELRDLLVEKLGLAEDVEVVEEGDQLVMRVVRPTLVDFLQELMKKKVPLVLCPYIATVQVVYSSRGVRLTFRGGAPREYGIDLVFRKV